MKAYLIGNKIFGEKFWLGNIVRSDGKVLGNHSSSSSDWLRDDLTDKIKNDGYEIIDLIGKEVPTEIARFLKQGEDSQKYKERVNGDFKKTGFEELINKKGISSKGDHITVKLNKEFFSNMDYLMNGDWIDEKKEVTKLKAENKRLEEEKDKFDFQYKQREIYIKEVYNIHANEKEKLKEEIKALKKPSLAELADEKDCCIEQVHPKGWWIIRVKPKKKYDVRGLSIFIADRKIYSEAEKLVKEFLNKLPNTRGLK